MDRWKGKVAVVTGASSGIGAIVCRDLVKAGVIVVGLARRIAKIESQKLNLVHEPGQLHARFCDVTNIESIDAAFRWVETQFGGVNILVNNAGIVKCTFVLAQENDNDLQDMMDTNFDGYLNCTKAAYRLMKKYHAEGHIVNINSILGRAPHLGTSMDSAPLANLYVPAKFAVIGLAEIIRQELNYLQNRKIKITTINPSIVKTNLYNQFPKSYKVYEYFGHLQPEDVSSVVIYVLGTKSNVQIQEITVRAVGEAF